MGQPTLRSCWARQIRTFERQSGWWRPIPPRCSTRTGHYRRSNSSFYIQPPYWMNSDGTVPRRASRPREIVGLSANLTLVPGAKASTVQRHPVNAQLVLTPLNDADVGLRFVMPHLEFPSNQSMQMAIDTAETAVQAPGDQSLQRRTAQGIDNRIVRLPLLNSNWAFADTRWPPPKRRRRDRGPWALLAR